MSDRRVRPDGDRLAAVVGLAPFAPALLGAPINLEVIVGAAGPAVVQSVLLIGVVSGFSWWLGGRLGLEDRPRALPSAAVAICGVGAAIAAAGAVRARKEQLAYSASLVIVSARPSIFLPPPAATAPGLDPRVTGAWIGGDNRHHGGGDGGRHVGGRGVAAGRDDRQGHPERAARRGGGGADRLLRAGGRAPGLHDARRAAAAGPVPRVRARVPGHVDHRRGAPVGGAVGQGRDRGGERPAHVVPDPGVRRRRPGVPARCAAAGGVAPDRRVRRLRGGERGGRPRAGGRARAVPRPVPVPCAPTAGTGPRRWTRW